MQSVFTTAVVIASWLFASLTLAAGVTPSRKAQSTMPPAFVENVGQAKFSDGRAATYVGATVALPGATAYVCISPYPEFTWIRRCGHSSGRTTQKSFVSTCA